MIYHDVVQRSPEWDKLRLGIATASCFDKIINPETAMRERSKITAALELLAGSRLVPDVANEFSVTEPTVKGWMKKYEGLIEPPPLELLAGAETYAHFLLAELITGESLDKFPHSYWMERGTVYEIEAINLYAFQTGLRVDRGGFITNDAGTAGCSPDIRVFDGETLIGAAEIKCPAPWTHVENLLRDEIDPQYKPQIQGQMTIGGFEFIDWFSYHPDMPPALIRTKRDEPYCKILDEALDLFDKLMKAKIEKLKEKGVLIIDKGEIKPAPEVSLEDFLMAG